MAWNRPLVAGLPARPRLAAPARLGRAVSRQARSGVAFWQGAGGGSSCVCRKSGLRTDGPPFDPPGRALEHAAFTHVHAARSGMCWIARLSAFGDSASTHRALRSSRILFFWGLFFWSLFFWSNKYDRLIGYCFSNQRVSCRHPAGDFVALPTNAADQQAAEPKGNCPVSEVRRISVSGHKHSVNSTSGGRPVGIATSCTGSLDVQAATGR